MQLRSQVPRYTEGGTSECSAMVIMICSNQQSLAAQPLVRIARFQPSGLKALNSSTLADFPVLIRPTSSNPVLAIDQTSE